MSKNDQRQVSAISGKENSLILLVKIHNNICLVPSDKHKLLFTKGSVLSNEYSTGNFYAAEKAFIQAQKEFEKQNDQVGLTKLLVNRADNWMQMGDTTRFLHTMDSLLINTTHDTPFLTYYKHINIGDYFYEINKITNAKCHYQKALAALSKSPCNEERDILHAYLAEVYLTEENIDSTALMLDRLFEYKECSGIDSNAVMYYIRDIQYQFEALKLKKGQKINQESLISLLYERRSYATKMFDNEEDSHLGDLYDQNTHRILDAYSQLYGSNIPLLEKSRLLDLLHHNSSNKIKREKLRNLTKKQKTKQLEINQLLKEVNDFKNDYDYANPAYKRLYELLVLEAEDFSNISVPLSPKYLKSENFYCIFSSYSNFLWRVDVMGDNVKLNKLDYNKVISLKRQFIKAIDSKYKVEKIREQLTKEIFNGTSKIDFIIPEKHTITLPLQYLYGDAVEIEYSFIQHNSQELESHNSVVFSYSDAESLKETEDLEHIELASGLKESKSVSKILNNHRLLMDEHFTEDAIIENSNVDIMHFSTHGIVNTEVRQDCYLVVNDKDGLAEKFYGYDIIKMDEAPKFVNLSACDTGIGYQLDGNGTYSLSREFIRNGSEAVLKTLWKVDDKATYLFQTKLYVYWSNGFSLGESITSAQSHLKSHKEYSHPYYWAGFVLEGNPNLYLK